MIKLLTALVNTVLGKKEVRYRTADKYCPFCLWHETIIFDLTHDCCTNCNSKYEISDKAKSEHIEWLDQDQIDENNALIDAHGLSVMQKLVK